MGEEPEVKQTDAIFEQLKQVNPEADRADGLGGAWAGWTVPGPIWVVTGLVLASLIGLLAVAALGGRYRLAAATGVNGWAIFLADIIVMASLAEIAANYTYLLFGLHGLASSNLALIIGAVFLLAPVDWVTAAAMAASCARIAVTARLLRAALAR